jgi:hypothetical protein
MWIADGTQKRTDTGTQHHAQVWTVKRKACVIAEADGKDRNRGGKLNGHDGGFGLGWFEPTGKARGRG